MEKWDEMWKMFTDGSKDKTSIVSYNVTQKYLTGAKKVGTLKLTNSC